MKTLKKIILFAFISAVFLTCKKEELTPSTIEGQPVFYFTGTIGSSSLTLQAGVNNYYMYSSYNQDSLGVYNFIGNLQSTSTKNNSIEIIINDYKASAANASVAAHIDSSLSPSLLYAYAKPGADTTYSVLYTPRIYSGTPMSYFYAFGDGTISALASPTHIYKNTGTYPTSLSIKFSSGGPITMYDTINIFKIPSQPFPPPQLWIDSIQSKIGNVILDSVPVTFTAVISNGMPPYTYTWNFGDGSSTSSISSTNSTSTIHHVYTDTSNLKAIYPVYLKVKDALGHSESYNYKVWGDSATSPNALMDYTISPPVPVLNLYSLSDVIINYTDINGNVYTSNNSLQPGSSNFVINSVSAYQNNLNNNPTKELKVTFNCMLYPVFGGAPITANNCTAVIAVAYH